MSDLQSGAKTLTDYKNACAARTAAINGSPNPYIRNNMVAIPIILKKADGSTLSGRGDVVTITDINGGLWCIYSTTDSGGMSGSNVGEVHEQSGTSITEFLPPGTYTITAYQNQDGAAITLGDIWNPATNFLIGTKIWTGYVTATVSMDADNHARMVAASQYILSINKAGTGIGADNNVTKSNPVKVVVQESSQGGLVNDLITGAINKVLEGMNALVGLGIKMINGLLNWEKGKILNQASLGSAWTAIRNLGLSLLTIILVIIAFANALQFNIERYGVNRLIPKIIIAIILAYLSWAIVSFFFDLAQALQDAAWSIAKSQGMTEVFQAGVFSAGDAAASIADLVVAGVLLVLVTLSIFGLLIMLVVRVVMLSFLIVIAPLAFILYILPFTESYYRRWWSTFFKWLFMGPLVVVILAIGLLVLNPLGGPVASIPPSMLKTGGVDTLIRLLIFSGFLVFAAVLPLTLGGGIMRPFGRVTGPALTRKAGQKAWQPLQKKYIEPRRKFIEERKGLKAERKQAERAEKWSQKGEGKVGQFVTGASPEQAATLKQRAQDNWIKSQNPDQYTVGQTHDKKFEAWRKGNKFEAEAWANYEANLGTFTAGVSEEQKQMNQEIFDEFASGNGALQRGIAKNDLHLYMLSTNPEFRKIGAGRFAKKNIADRTMDEVEAAGVILSNPGKVGSTIDSSEYGTIKETVWQTDAAGLSRVATRGGGKQIYAYTDPNVLTHMNTNSVRHLNEILERRQSAAAGKEGADAIKNVQAELAKPERQGASTTSQARPEREEPGPDETPPDMGTTSPRPKPQPTPPAPTSATRPYKTTITTEAPKAGPDIIAPTTKASTATKVRAEAPKEVPSEVITPAPKPSKAQEVPLTPTHPAPTYQERIEKLPQSSRPARKLNEEELHTLENLQPSQKPKPPSVVEVNEPPASPLASSLKPAESKIKKVKVENVEPTPTPKAPEIEDVATIDDIDIDTTSKATKKNEPTLPPDSYNINKKE